MNLNDALNLKEEMRVYVSDFSILSQYSLSREKEYVIKRVVPRYLEDNETKEIIPTSIEVIISNDVNNDRTLHHSMIEVVRHSKYSAKENRLYNWAAVH